MSYEYMMRNALVIAAICAPFVITLLSLLIIQWWKERPMTFDKEAWRKWFFGKDSYDRGFLGMFLAYCAIGVGAFWFFGWPIVCMFITNGRFNTNDAVITSQSWPFCITYLVIFHILIPFGIWFFMKFITLEKKKHKSKFVGKHDPILWRQ